jgi:uncharacterized protein involved in response to NO
MIRIEEARAVRPEPTTPAWALFSAGFRPFFLLAGVWAAVAVPAWLAAYVHGYALHGALPAMTWHAHEMLFGFGLAAVAGFLLTAIPNWTGRLPLRGTPLAALAALWLAGRVALLASAAVGPTLAALVDLAFPAALIVVVARELVAGRNWRNLPVLAALGLLFGANALIHAHALGIAFTSDLGQRLGIGTLAALVAFMGGRIVPSFTRNWLAKERPGIALPAPAGRLDAACLAVTLAGLLAWVTSPDATITPVMLVLGGTASALRLSRWCGFATLREPLVFVLHAGYAWLALGLAWMGLNGAFGWVPPGAAVHALTAGAIGTMTLAVMTRATLGHTGRALAAGLAWTGAFGTFVVVYGPMLLSPRRPA